MNVYMRPRIERVERAREELRTALRDLEQVCDHRDKNGEKRVVIQGYEWWESVDHPPLEFCDYCGKEV